MNALISFMAIAMLFLLGATLIIGPSVIFTLTYGHLADFSTKDNGSHCRENAKVCHLLPLRVQVPLVEIWHEFQQGQVDIIHEHR